MRVVRYSTAKIEYASKENREREYYILCCNIILNIYSQNPLGVFAVSYGSSVLGWAMYCYLLRAKKSIHTSVNATLISIVLYN